MVQAADPAQGAQFLRFAAVGVTGFVVDAGMLYLMIAHFELGPYGARLVSWLAAASTTWHLNRQWTFADRASTAPVRQWVRYLAANAWGGGVNYLVFALVLWSLPSTRYAALAGVAAGSFAGLVFNFLASRHFVFHKRPVATLGQSPKSPVATATDQRP